MPRDSGWRASAAVLISGPSGAVPGETEGRVVTGKPESGEIPGCGGATESPAGKPLFSALGLPEVFGGVALFSGERLGMVGLMSGVPSVGLTPALFLEAAGFAALPTGAEEAALEPAVVAGPAAAEPPARAELVLPAEAAPAEVPALAEALALPAPAAPPAPAPPPPAPPPPPD